MVKFVPLTSCARQVVFISRSGVGSIWLRHSLENFKLCLKALKAKVLRILTDRGTEYCGKPEQHDFQLFLAINDNDHTKTKAKLAQANGICERFHKTILQKFYQVAFRRKVYESLDQLQADLDNWIEHYKTERTHQGKRCCGRTPFQTMIEGIEIWKAKFIN